MTALFASPPSPPKIPEPPEPPAPTPFEDTPEGKAAAARERARAKATTGRASTILTGGLGDTSAPTGLKKKLLGE